MILQVLATGYRSVKCDLLLQLEDLFQNTYETTQHFQPQGGKRFRQETKGEPPWGQGKPNLYSHSTMQVGFLFALSST